MKIYLPHPSLLNPIQRFFIILIIIILLLTLIVTKGRAQTQEHLFINKVATEYVAEATNHALVIGIIQNGKQEIFTFGETERGKGVKPTNESVFEIGTVSEVFTTSLLALLESEGKISSLDAVGNVLKDKVKVPYYQRIICVPPPTIGNTTSSEDLAHYRGNICYPDPNDAPQMMVLCDLATHSAGFPSTPSLSLFNTKNPYANYSLSKLNRDVSELPPNQAFGYQYNHSLIGMGLLGEALSVKTEKPYENLLKEKILDPLSMTHTFIKPTPQQADLFLNGHTTKGKITLHRDYNALIPAIGIRSNVPDLLRFLEANLKPTGRFNTALSETHIPRLFTDHTSRDYMIGWSWISKPITAKSKKRLYWQCSEQGGFASFIGFIKENNIAVVVLSNSANRVDDIGLKILEYLQNVQKTVSID